MTDLHTRLQDLAQNFAASILDALKGASLQQVLGGGSSVGNGRGASRRAAPPTARTAAPPRAKAARSTGRLPRRSAEEITKALEQVVVLVKKNAEGLRAEEIRQALSLQAKEMPRILKEGLAKKQLRTKGQKRATTYFAK